MAAAADAGQGGAVSVDLLHERRMVCVEYPGLVRDVSKMLLTLGGEESVSRVRSVESPGSTGADNRGTTARGAGPPRDARFPWQWSLRLALQRPAGGDLLLRPLGVDRFFFAGRGRGKRTIGRRREGLPSSDEPQLWHFCLELSSAAAPRFLPPQDVLDCHILISRSRKLRYGKLGTVDLSEREEGRIMLFRLKVVKANNLLCTSYSSRCFT